MNFTVQGVVLRKKAPSTSFFPDKFVSFFFHLTFLYSRPCLILSFSLTLFSLSLSLSPSLSRTSCPMMTPKLRNFCVTAPARQCVRAREIALMRLQRREQKKTHLLWGKVTMRKTRGPLNFNTFSCFIITAANSHFRATDWIFTWMQEMSDVIFVSLCAF